MRIQTTHRIELGDFMEFISDKTGKDWQEIEEELPEEILEGDFITETNYSDVQILYCVLEYMRNHNINSLTVYQDL